MELDRMNTSPNTRQFARAFFIIPIQLGIRKSDTLARFWFVQSGVSTLFIAFCGLVIRPEVLLWFGSEIIASTVFVLIGCIPVIWSSITGYLKISRYYNLFKDE